MHKLLKSLNVDVGIFQSRFDWRDGADYSLVRLGVA